MVARAPLTCGYNTGLFCLLKKEKEKGMELGEWGGGEDLLEAGRGKP